MIMAAKSPEARERYHKYLRELYRWYKDHGICTYCKRVPAEPGRTQCKACTKRIKARRDRQDPGREKRNARTNAWRERMKAEGRCVNCGSPAVPGRTHCKACAKKQKESSQVRQIRKRIARENAKRDEK